MIDLERTWNHKFNYPWTFFNDEPFSEEFKKKTSAVTKAKCNYGTRQTAIAKIREKGGKANESQRSFPPSTGLHRPGSTWTCLRLPRLS